MLLENNDRLGSSRKVYKLTLKLMNAIENSTCFPNNLYGEFYNIDQSVIFNSLIFVESETETLQLLHGFYGIDNHTYLYHCS